MPVLISSPNEDSFNEHHTSTVVVVIVIFGRLAAALAILILSVAAVLSKILTNTGLPVVPIR